MENNIYITNIEEFNEKKRKIINDGIGDLVVLADFDSTLTYALLNGKKTPSMVSILREGGGYLGDEYSVKASFFAKKYFPIQDDPTIEKEEKNSIIEEWYINHFKLLIEKKLNKKHFKRMINDPKIRLRDGVDEVLSFLNQHEIPLSIISASILGDEPILIFLRKKNMLYQNIKVISNSFLWDENDNAVSYKEPIFHSGNKDKALSNKPVYFKKIKNRKNVLLLGDTLDDINMIGDLEYKNLIKVCFLNEKTDKKINDYKKVYDVLILNDSSMEFVSELLKELKIN